MVLLFLSDLGKHILFFNVAFPFWSLMYFLMLYNFRIPRKETKWIYFRKYIHLHKVTVTTTAGRKITLRELIIFAKVSDGTELYFHCNNFTNLQIYDRQFFMNLQSIWKNNMRVWRNISVFMNNSILKQEWKQRLYLEVTENIFCSFYRDSLKN